MPLRIFLRCFFASILITNNVTSQEILIHNTLKEIESCKNKIDLELIKVWSFEESGDEEMAFHRPKMIEIDKSEKHYIIDSFNYRVQVFDSNGRFLYTIGREGQGPGEFSLPNGIAIDENKQLIISDAFNRRIQLFDSTGHFINSFNLIDRIGNIR